MAFELDLSDLLSSSDVELFRGAAGAIDYAAWQVSNATGREVPVSALPSEHQVVARLAAFRGLFGGGGLSAWFERDGDEHGEGMVHALAAVGLGRSAKALSEAYDLFRQHDAWDVYDERMALLSERRAQFDSLADEVWAEFDNIEGAGGRFVRSHREALERGT
ncbi:MAG: DUF4375 domain-containing protein [Planctomycetes bacterium]|nr:DUF4375 domain-containing protein [Planctomycetota bacterium]